jgi:hypothetical protein
MDDRAPPAVLPGHLQVALAELAKLDRLLGLLRRLANCGSGSLSTGTSAAHRSIRTTRSPEWRSSSPGIIDPAGGDGRHPHVHADARCPVNDNEGVSGAPFRITIALSSGGR